MWKYLLSWGIATCAMAQQAPLCDPSHELVDAYQVVALSEATRQRLLEEDRPLIERDRVRAEVRRAVRTKSGKTRYVTRAHTEERLYRHITIGAYDACDGRIHLIPIRVPHPLPVRTTKGKTTPVFSFESLDASYDVVHQGGVGVARMKFGVTYDDRELIVLGLRHPRFSSAYWRTRDARIIAQAVPVVYTPYHPMHHALPATPALLRLGYSMWMADIRRVDGPLGRTPSLAFPGKSLGEVWPRDMLMVLGIIEQSDDGAWRSDPLRTAEAVLIEYALNPEPFYFSNSVADAIGLYQFTNKNGNGTYSMTRRLCPMLSLRPDFDPGARDGENGMKSAVCLLDYELAELPSSVRELFLEDYRLGSTYPVAAYNGGGGQAMKLYRALPPEDVASVMETMNLPMRAFAYRKRGSGQVRINHETQYYLVKMFGAWNIVTDWTEQFVP